MYQAAWKLLVIMCHNISPSLSFLFSFNCAIYSLWQLVPNMEHPFNKELLRGAYKRAQTLRLTQRPATLRLHAVVGQRHKFACQTKKKKKKLELDVKNALILN